MTFLHGAALGLVGAILNELLSLYAYRRDNMIWSWENKSLGMTMPFYLFGVFVRFTLAFIVVGLLASNNEIKSNWFALVAGACAEPVFDKAVAVFKGGNT
jgi:hypothetical protein